MGSSDLLVGLSFFCYLLTLLIIGVVAWRRTRNLSDFVLGGRSLGSWVTALSASASDMSGWLLLGLPGYAYLAGLESFWLALGLLIGTWLNWRLVAARLRIASEMSGNALTLPEYLSNRFNDASGLIRISSSFFILLFFLFYTSSGLVAGGKLFEAVFGLPYLWAVASGALIIILYTAFGGFLAVSWTDLFQGLLMLLALVTIPLYVLVEIGGLEGFLSTIEGSNAELLNPMTDSNGEPLGVIAIVSLMAWGLGYFGQPHILARFKAIKQSDFVPKAQRIAVSWVFITLTAATLSGLVGIPIFETPLEDAEKVFIRLVDLLFHPLVAGVCLAAILAAIMSTADSQLLVSSSTFTGDLYRLLLRKRASEAELVIVGRLAVLSIALIAFLLALDSESRVLDLVSYAWAGFGAAFGPAVLLSLYWKGMNRWGALAGILSGGLTVVLWKPLQGGLFDLYEIVPGFLISLAMIVLVSRLTSSRLYTAK
ncbi:MAG: sodium/proline symporter PutP [Candidatus Thiodiazotropha sp. (ex Lucina aurantia)]|uniref:Sodium/proline symporter n=1 Tax=Candidatus Thiodiazotropha endolucinida TaxID=1655433 RepID=A0A7Z0VNU9_9GAMM|nr:sodium/proline symporter PutP [Candidatus Thiodiazotropha endolucinida]MBT3012705.1 sodium/proline symporter PutP [Candidatus Thiodiazotropha sp. (ex Lucina pensylvanica)]MBT3024194.1 sodium/proline symporter PutP [Candidatus Thiodiazotropha taylori]MBT3039657.1 sodium/proline symporter PutP [Candidatus Thiodiazotropha sp. (ex Codakia orbicularis)]MBV2103729.1 sodium/proline symporter PutP [Candidatus Thiodiazotropha sp. (ex Lucina aurantia)]MBT3031499.1 sodium/proline symporter PutP [Candi